MQETGIIGRDEEKLLLKGILANTKADLVAVYGRRRIGKTYLIRSYLKKHIVLEYSGIHNVETAVQLTGYCRALATQLNNNIALPEVADWFAAFELTARLLQKKMRRKKVVFFLDEFPWLQTPKSNFLAAFEQFWNTWASKQHNLAVILCGSAASWMIQNVVRNKGGLHNRITHKIALQPFTLNETEAFLKSRNVQLNRYQVTQLYMAFGGVPHYLEQAATGLSAAQIIDKACFAKNGFLYNEFTDLYKALFDSADRHFKVIRALAAKPMGLNRNEIIKACKLQSGGSTTALLEELTASGFITPYVPVEKKVKDSIYKLTDEYSLFYLKFMEANRSGSKGTWVRLSDTPTWKSWSGLAFESICMKHIPAIKKALGIGGIYSETAIWKSKGNSIKGAAQIDLVISRRDNCINLCEIKFYENKFSLDKKYAAALQQKKYIFQQETKTRKHLFITLITSTGLQANEHSLGLIDQQLTLDDLFIPMQREG
ncbi:AAA family ATPase [Ferruginibacter sp. SUN106]|uniref:AAA family ATPase n=1 Tax=Ferruginibacter sp. SUN106 TaxID=2978348 RepID=UPI003D364F82